MAAAEPQSRDNEIVREILKVATDVAPLPWWLPRWLAGFAAALFVATVIVLARQIDFGALYAAWAKAATPPPLPSAPAMPMPEGGMPLDQRPMEPTP